MKKINQQQVDNSLWHRGRHKLDKDNNTSYHCSYKNRRTTLGSVLTKKNPQVLTYYVRAMACSQDKEQNQIAETNHTKKSMWFTPILQTNTKILVRDINHNYSNTMLACRVTVQ
jgi:hypothetical protein